MWFIIKNKYKHMKKRNIILAVVIGFFGILLVTNPSEKDHKDSIKENLIKTLEPKKPTSGWELLGWKMGQQIALAAIDNSVKRNNYILFSTVQAENGKMITLGILGYVKYFPKTDIF